MAPTSSTSPPSASTSTPTTSASEFALNWLRQHAPTPSDAHEAVALAVHAILLHYEFRPSNAIGTATATATDNADNNNNDNVPTTLPPDWGGAGYGGRYRHIRSAMLFDIRSVQMGGRLVVHAVAAEDDTRLNTVDVRVNDFYTATNTNDNNNNDDIWLRLTDMDGLATLVAVQIAHKLVPEGSKHGYEHSSTATESQSQSQPTPTPVPMPGPRPIPPHPDNDPLRIGPIRDPRYPLMPNIQPHPLGHDDLLPAGLPRPGFLDPMGGGIGGVPGPSRTGGNLMGPNHFQNMPGRTPPGVPPGARFDPYSANPDPDAEMLPGFEDDHRLRGGGGRGRANPSRGGLPMFPPPPPGGGGLDDGPPPGMYF